MKPALCPLIEMLAEQLVNAHLRALAEESRTPQFDQPRPPAQNAPHAESETGQAA